MVTGLTRAELGAQLERAGLAAKGVRLALITIYAELEGVICSGPRRGKQITYTLPAQRARRAARLSRDEALAELTRRYFTSHGPATVGDFLWRSGLATADAKRGLEMNRARHDVVDDRTCWRLGGTTVDVTRRRTVHLLPVYDEHLVAYRDREAVPHAPSAIASRSRGNVTLQHALVIAGADRRHVEGRSRHQWSHRRCHPAKRLTGPERRALGEAAGCYSAFWMFRCRCPSRDAERRQARDRR
jgi:hypothetical protein